jgi:MFS superfamily sulfate permease-like transporter
MNRISNPLKNLGYDLPASLVVFLVALPLCLGVAHASTDRSDLLFSGIIAGVVGGIVVGILSGSSLGVSGPAAGLIAIVFDGIKTLETFEVFLLSVFFAGVIQLVAGFLKAGIIGYYFPSSVIKGMLTAIGIMLILKEIPHFFGYDKDFMGDESFKQEDGHNTFSELYYAVRYSSTGAIIISLISLGLLILFDRPFMRKIQLFKFLPGALFVVLTGILINNLFVLFAPDFALNGEHLVQLPVAGTVGEFISFFKFPDFSAIANPHVYKVALTIAIVASIETLLSVEATDKLDPYKRNTPTNRELKAQGVGNMISGLIGGLPITQVIVRSSANINSGGKTKLATIIHGSILLMSVIFVPVYLNFIPLASLAAILLLVGYKLAKPSIFRTMFRDGVSQFVPFVITIVAIIFTDLLIGIGIGLVVGLYFVLQTNFHEAISITTDNNNNYLLRLNKDVSFLNKSLLRKSLERIPKNSTLIIDGGHSQFIDHDIIETLKDFMDNASSKNITVEVKRNYSAHHTFFRRKD